MRTNRTVHGVILLVGLCLGPRVAEAGFVFTSNPAGAWNYSYQDGGPGNFDSGYFSTSLSDVSGATFQGMVLYNSIDSGSGVFGPGYEPSGSTYRVFSTFVTSATDQTIHLGLSGDDGHSLFVNGTFVAGAGFGGTFASPNASYDLSLTAGVEVPISLVGHDAYGSSWVFGITDPESYRGVRLSAISANGVAPEPSSILLVSIGGLVLLGGRRLCHAHIAKQGEHANVAAVFTANRATAARASGPGVLAHNRGFA